MKLLLDANLSHRLIALRGTHVTASHVRDHGLQHADDEAIFDFAAAGDFVLVSEDTDFEAILAIRNVDRPSVVLVRSADPLTPEDQARLLLANLPALEAHLAAGSIVVIDRSRMRVRRLPFLPRD